MTGHNSPEAVGLYVLLPAVLAVTLTYGYLGARRGVRRLLDRVEAWLDAKIARHVDLALGGPWGDGLDQAAVDRIWDSMQADLADGAA